MRAIRRTKSLASVTLAVLFLASCNGSDGDGGSEPAPDAERMTLTLDIELVRSLDELLGETEIVVVGTPSERATAVEIAEPAAALAGDNQFIEYEQDVQVEAVLRGDASLRSVRVLTTAVNFASPSLVEAVEASVLDLGPEIPVGPLAPTSVVLFLQPAGPVEGRDVTGAYTVVGVYQGAIPVRDGRLDVSANAAELSDAEYRDRARSAGSSDTEAVARLTELDGISVTELEERISAVPPATGDHD